MHEMGRLRIVSVDHYMSKPIPGLDDLYSELRGREVSKVPVIRIFGVSDLGMDLFPHFSFSLTYIILYFRREVLSTHPRSLSVF